MWNRIGNVICGAMMIYLVAWVIGSLALVIALIWGGPSSDFIVRVWETGAVIWIIDIVAGVFIFG